MADRFEYRNHSPFFGPGRPHATRDEWEAGLNALGAEGWELVAPVDIWGMQADGSVSNSPHSLLLLKRRLG
jgi:hypothetical protein